MTDDDIVIYTVMVDGKEYRSTSPITAEQVRGKIRTMANSNAFAEGEECEDCNKETEDNLVKW